MKSAIIPGLLLLLGVVLFLALGSLAWQWPVLLWLLSNLLIFSSRWQQAWLHRGGFFRFFLLLAVLVAVFLSSPWGNWLALGTAVLWTVLAFKVLELRGMRDLMQIAALVLLGMGLAAWIRVDLALGLYFLAELFLLLLALLWQTYIEQRQQEGRLILGSDLLRLAFFDLFFLLFLLPMMALLFVLLPRTPTPLWHWGVGAANAQSGFAPKLDPQHIEKLQLDPAVAFRAQITGPALLPADLYWVGAVLWQDDGGLHWLPGPTPPECGRSGAHIWQQQIIVSPGRHRYLFALETPLDVDSPMPLASGTTSLILAHAVDGPLRYRAWSGRAASCLTTGEKTAALQVPASLSPEIRVLAQQLRGQNSQETVQRIVRWFQGPSFRYSLHSPPGYPRGQTLADFLLRTHTGFCEYYAAGLATLLRLDGVPARVVVGYRGGEYDSLGGFWQVRQSMAHAWVQAWFGGRWHRLDVTPAATPSNASVSGGSALAAQLPWGSRLWGWLQWHWLNWVIDFSPEKQRTLWRMAGEDLQSASHHSPIQHNFQWPNKLPRLPIILLLILILGGLALGLGRWFRERRQDRRQRYRERAITLLRKKGLADCRPGMEFLWLESLPLDPALRCRLGEAIARQRYGPSPDAAGERALKELLKVLAKAPAGDHGPDKSVDRPAAGWQDDGQQ